MPWVQKWMLGLAALGWLSGCNVFSGLDHPDTQAQYQAAGDACFDHGDYACAASYYALLNPDASDLKASDQVFLALAQSGITVEAFILAIENGGSDAGAVLTELTNSIANLPHVGLSLRLTLLGIYQLTSNLRAPITQGLVRFVTSLALAAEILAEDASQNADGSFSLKQSDLVVNPLACITASDVPFPIPGCAPPAGRPLISGTSSIYLPSATVSQFSGAPSLQMLVAALSEMLVGAAALNLAGALEAAVTIIANVLATAAADGAIDSSGSTLFRQFMIQIGIGTSF